MRFSRNTFNYKSTTSFFILFGFQLLFTQNSSPISDYLVGYWEGAFIKNNSYQKIEIDFSIKDDKIYGLQIMDEWHPTFGEFEVPVKIDSTDLISFGTGYGKAELKLDKNNLEMIGQIEGFNPAIYLHLKKTANLPATNYSINQVSIESGKLVLNGHLHLPYHNPKKTAVILVGGRGCYADATKYNLYAKFLRRYGVAVLAYQKRGTGSSSGKCDSATIGDLANDLKAIKLFLENHESNFHNIGVLGISAGGWTMTKAEEDANFDFMISIVGPSTSVRDQQLQSASYGADFYQLKPNAKKKLLTYTNLMFESESSQQGFQTMKSLLQSSEEEGWRALLEDTDIPNNASELENLWVRRHNFDPQNILRNFNKPFLAIYGERDWIVPQKENIELLEVYFKNKLEKLSIVTAYNAEHGMEMEAKQINIGQNHSYWHFYRISPEVRIGIVDFLRENNFID